MTELDTAARLRCLGDCEAPPGLADDLRCLAGVPAAALGEASMLMRAALRDPLPRDLEEHLDAFCGTHVVDGGALGRGLKAARFVLRAAGSAGLDRAALEEDLSKLAPDLDARATGALLGLVEAAAATVRAEALALALTDHGKVLTGVDWRVDVVAASKRGATSRSPVVVLTLSYREGADPGRVTLQALPESILALRDACNEILALK